jgi:hypothetical protein
MHSGFAVPAPLLSRPTSMGFADAHGRVLVVEVGIGPHWAQQVGWVEVVDYDLLNSRIGSAATPEGSVGNR